jgi:hypothetical protein
MIPDGFSAFLLFSRDSQFFLIRGVWVLAFICLYPSLYHIFSCFLASQ